MENQPTVFILISPEVQEILMDNQIDLIETLQRDGLDISRGSAKDPTRGTDSGYKGDVPTIILASAALVVALTPAISKIVTALSHKAVLVRQMELKPVMDDQGNVVRDALGEPKLYWAPTTQLIESTEDVQSMPSIEVKGFGIDISLKP